MLMSMHFSHTLLFFVLSSVLACDYVASKDKALKILAQILLLLLTIAQINKPRISGFRLLL